MKVTEDLHLTADETSGLADVQRAMERCEEETGLCFRPVGVTRPPRAGQPGELFAVLARESRANNFHANYVLRGACE